MNDSLNELLIQSAWWGLLLRVLLLYLAAYVMHKFSRRITRRLINFERFRRRNRPLRKERLGTLQGLVANFITFFAFLLATLVTLTIFTSLDTLIWLVGLLSAGFGFAARPLVSDVLTGISFIFEDTLDVGEKVEIKGFDVEGVVEAITLRVTLLRANTGELFTVPNGEIRVIRNFSRGRFTQVKVSLRVSADKLAETIAILETMGREAVVLLPNLLEPWKIISETGTVGQNAELTLVARAKYSMGAEMRPRLLSLIQDRLAREGVELVD